MNTSRHTTRPSGEFAGPADEGNLTQHSVIGAAEHHPRDEVGPPAGPAGPRRTRRGLAQRPAIVLLALAAVLGLSVAGAGSASASFVGDDQFHALCSSGGVQAIAPDMQYHPDNYVAWNAVLYVWTDSGWMRYGESATQTAIGTNILSQDWSPGQAVQEADWFSLPRGHDYQIRVNAGWVGPGSPLLLVDTTIQHQLSQSNSDLTVIKYSTESYCYLP